MATRWIRPADDAMILFIGETAATPIRAAVSQANKRRLSHTNVQTQWFVAQVQA